MKELRIKRIFFEWIFTDFYRFYNISSKTDIHTYFLLAICEYINDLYRRPWISAVKVIKSPRAARQLDLEAKDKRAAGARSSRHKQTNTKRRTRRPFATNCNFGSIQVERRNVLTTLIRSPYVATAFSVKIYWRIHHNLISRPKRKWRSGTYWKWNESISYYGSKDASGFVWYMKWFT